ncbi:MAG: aminotransferase class I/II-fold pyridoxal phosphate-dependent enzyme [Candidatus Fermentibacteria bacterium]
MNKPFDPFDGYFNLEQDANPLLESSSARRLIESIGQASREDIYTYQQPLEGKSGPRVLLGGKPFLMVSSYDYLGLIGHPDIEAAALEAVRTYGTGTGGVRLLTGTTELHYLLERDIAAFKGTEAALTFSSGYLANLAVISTLFGPRDRIIIDSRAHRSIVEACRLSRVPATRFDHDDPTSLEDKLKTVSSECRTLIIVEGIYSMDGDICSLPEIVKLKKKYNALLMVDEAHSFGVLGSRGRGVNEYFGIEPEDVDIWMGTLSKAIPSNGGFIAGTRDLVILLQHASAPFIFSAALTPASAASAREALRVIEREPERLARLRRNAEYFRSSIIELGFDTGLSETAVIPIILGDDEKALQTARRLFSLGIIATPIVKPAVSPGSARLRLCATAVQDESFFSELFEGLRNLQ